MQNSHTFVVTVNALLNKLDTEPKLDNAIELAQALVQLLGFKDERTPESVYLDSTFDLPNAERYDSWFQPHPIFKSDRAVFDLVDAPLFQAKFYWLKKHSRQIIAGGVHFTPNFEDEDFTHNDRYKVGIDFFLSPSGKSLSVVLSNRGNLRIVELNGRLNSTQVDIFSKWIGADDLGTQGALHSTLWESFKLKSVNQKFYDGVANSFNELLQHLKGIDKDDEESKLFASRLLGRLLFCWFLRKKGIIDENAGYFEARELDATGYYRESLEKLFFLTLNTPVDEREILDHSDTKTPYLNGGLFEAHDNDWFKDDSLTFPEGFFANLFEHFEQFNFTTDESSPEYELIAIDPEMLGRVFESLLATQLDETGQQARKAKGAFYTPREIVSYMCKESLRGYLYNTVGNGDDTKASIDSLLDISDSEWAKAKSNTLRDKVKDYRLRIIDALDAVTILDPACGSGAFPMGMLQLIVKMYERLDGRFDPYRTKLQIIRKNIFGIDIEPMAVEIARLRAWLSLVVDEEDGRNVEPLPNLDFKFVCANSLIPLETAGQVDWLNSANSDLHEKLANLRNEYFNARKPHTKKAAQHKYYKLTKAPEGLFDDTRTKQLKSFDPFRNSHAASFFDGNQMFGINQPFDIIIGNPPYVNSKKIEKSIRTRYWSIYNEVLAGDMDLYQIFFVLGMRLLKEGGVLAYVSSNSFLTNQSFRLLRSYLLNNSIITSIHDFPHRYFPFENVNTETSFIILTKQRNNLETQKIGVCIAEKSKKVISLKVDTHTNIPVFTKYNGFFLGISELTSRIVKQNEVGSVNFKDIFMVSNPSSLDRKERAPLTSRKAYEKCVFTEEDIAQDDELKPIIEPCITGDKILRYVTHGEKLYTNTSWLKDGQIKHINKKTYSIMKEHKLVGQRITGQAKWRIVFTYDDQGLISMPSVNVITLRSPKYDDDTLMNLLGLLNSKLYNYLYKDIFKENNTNITSDVFDLIPILPSVFESEDLNRLVRAILVNGYSASSDSEINTIIYRLYGLSEDEIVSVERSIQ